VRGADHRPLVAVLDYGIGNLRSAQKALERVGADARLTADPGIVRDAEAVVLPGVGAFGACMEALHSGGLADLAVGAAASGRPFLGICVGLQLLYERSEESPGVAGLGILPGTVRLIPGDVKRPQMQWNVLEVSRPHPYLAGLERDAWVYFVHSYAADDAEHAVAWCDYGGHRLLAAAARDNVFAAQFHPEKSGANGLRLLANVVASLRGCTP
jgi:imidazole glycerol-phosphate synthase subunit HisH